MPMRGEAGTWKPPRRRRPRPFSWLVPTRLAGRKAASRLRSHDAAGRSPAPSALRRGLPADVFGRPARSPSNTGAPTAAIPAGPPATAPPASRPPAPERATVPINRLRQDPPARLFPKMAGDPSALPIKPPEGQRQRHPRPHPAGRDHPQKPEQGKLLVAPQGAGSGRSPRYGRRGGSRQSPGRGPARSGGGKPRRGQAQPGEAGENGVIQAEKADSERGRLQRRP